VESEGIDKDYSLSLEKASSAAEKKLHKGLNVYLVDKGIKNKNNGMKKWENLQTKVAQNVYEGLDNVRNENVTKEVGTVKEPLDSLKYYDGTSKVFGGSKDASLMDYSQVTSLKSEDALVYGAAAIGVTPEQYAELLENEPTVVWDEDTQTWIDSA
jgi:hypothetical protein